MADQTPISDELDGNRPGSGADIPSEHSPAAGAAPQQSLDVDAEPNDTDSQLPPQDDTTGASSSVNLFEEETGADDAETGSRTDVPADDSGIDEADDMFGSDDEDENDADEDSGDQDEDSDDLEEIGGLDVDAEPNDTDSQIFPPHGLEHDSDEDDMDDLIPDEMIPGIGEVHEMEEGVSAEQMAGTVALVGVPIGHRDDITFRALRTLQMADVVVCEEYKTAARLLRNYNISKKLIEMNEHNENEASDEVIDLVRKGKKIAVISDAGLPVLADPGRLLSVKLRKLGVEPKIIPGVSSVMTGLMASGYSMERFEFVGFLPRKPEERRNAAESLVDRDSTLVILEAPYRLRSLLAALSDAMPERRAALAINLTTSFETTIRGTLAELNAKFAQKRFKGEFVVVLDRLKPTDLGISTTAGFDPNEISEEFDEDEENGGFDGEFGETEEMDLSPNLEQMDLTEMDAGERPLRRPPPRTIGDGRGPSRPSGRPGDRPERAPRRDDRGGERGFDRGGDRGGNRGFDRGGDRDRNDRPRREGGFDDRRGREGARENRWGGGAPRDNRGGGGPPRENRWNREGGGERREGGFRREGGREERPNRGGERREGGRGFTPREGGGGGRGFTPREGGGGRGFTPREGGSRGFTPREGGGGRGFTPREGGGGGRGFTPRDGGGGRGFTPREGGGERREGGRGFTPREGGGGGRGFTPREGGGGSRGFTPRDGGGSRGFGGGNRGFGGGGPKGRGGNRGGSGSRGGGGGWR